MLSCAAVRYAEMVVCECRGCQSDVATLTFCTDGGVH
jgi:hypothetical protein